MISRSLILLSLILILAINIESAKLSSGQLSIVVRQQSKSDQKYKLNINSKIKSTLQLTQSSKIHIEAKLQFTPSSFKPQFFSFRLKHNQHQNLTQPILVKYDSNQDIYNIIIDLGDPRQIKPFSDKYQLQIIIADEQLNKNIRHIIADCNVVFRKSWNNIPNSQLHYKNQKIIQTQPPAERIDPPKLFTLFVVILIIFINVIFYYGLNYLKVNVNLFPKNSKGLFMNFAFLIILMINLAILFKFWINWTFLDTLQSLIILILPTALIANYAFVHIKKQ